MSRSVRLPQMGLTITGQRGEATKLMYFCGLAAAHQNGA